MRVLTVARWWPSHDAPGRGSFVRDLVDATVHVGVDARVVSFDRLIVKSPDPEQAQQLKAAALAIYERIATPENLFRLPTAFGAPGVPVARLPIMQLHHVHHPAALLQDHLEILRPFVRHLVQQWRPDVIHAHTGVPDGIVAADVAREHGIPIVVTEHASTVATELLDPAAAEGYRALLAPDVVLLAVSPPSGARLAALLGIQPGRIGYLPNPVFAGEFAPDANGRRDADSLLYVGSLGDHKGVDVLLRAVAELRASRPELHLRLIGRDSNLGDQDRLEALAQTLQIEDAVTFGGWMTRTDVAAAMRRASLLVHPSASETFGVVAVEAILSGLPVAARRSGGVPWIVQRSGGFGAVAEDDSPATFATAIDSVLSGRLPVDAATARSRLAEEFSAGVVAAKLLGIYEGLLGQGSSSARPPAPVAAGAGVTRPPLPLPRVLVGKSRALAAWHVRSVPDALRRHLVLVVPHSPSGASSEALRDLRTPLVEAPARRRRPLDRLARMRPGRHEGQPQSTNSPLGDAVLNAAASVRQSSEVVEIVAIDAAAAVVVAGLDQSQVRLAPGSLRWLVDSWDAAGATSSR